MKAGAFIVSCAVLVLLPVLLFGGRLGTPYQRWAAGYWAWRLPSKFDRGYDDEARNNVYWFRRNEVFVLNLALRMWSKDRKRAKEEGRELEYRWGEEPTAVERWWSKDLASCLLFCDDPYIGDEIVEMLTDFEVPEVAPWLLRDLRSDNQVHAVYALKNLQKTTGEVLTKPVDPLTELEDSPEAADLYVEWWNTFDDPAGWRHQALRKWEEHVRRRGWPRR